MPPKDAIPLSNQFASLEKENPTFEVVSSADPQTSNPTPVMPLANKPIAFAVSAPRGKKKVGKGPEKVTPNPSVAALIPPEPNELTHDNQLVVDSEKELDEERDADHMVKPNVPSPIDTTTGRQGQNECQSVEPPLIRNAASSGRGRSLKETPHSSSNVTGAKGNGVPPMEHGPNNDPVKARHRSCSRGPKEKGDLVDPSEKVKRKNQSKARSSSCSARPKDVSSLHADPSQ